MMGVGVLCSPIAKLGEGVVGYKYVSDVKEMQVREATIGEKQQQK